MPDYVPPRTRTDDYHPARPEGRQKSPKIDAARIASMIRVNGKIPQGFTADRYGETRENA